MVGILVSFWDGLFSGAMLVSGSVPSLISSHFLGWIHSHFWELGFWIHEAKQKTHMISWGFLYLGHPKPFFLEPPEVFASLFTILQKNMGNLIFFHISNLTAATFPISNLPLYKLRKWSLKTSRSWRNGFWFWSKTWRWNGGRWRHDA